MSQFMSVHLPPDRTNPDCFREALPCGNGRVGTLLCGGTDWEKMLINHEKLWHEGIRTPLPDCRDVLPKTREKINAGEYSAANGLLCDTLHNRGYRGELSVPHPLAMFSWNMDGRPQLTDYERSLQLESGEAKVSCGFDEVRVERKMFVSRPDELIVWQMEASYPISGDFSVGLVPAEGQATESAVQKMLACSQCTVTDSVIRFYSENEMGLSFGCVLKAVSDGVLRQNGDKIRFEKARKLTVKILPTVCTTECASGASGLEDVRSEEDYEVLFCRHKKEHETLFLSSAVSFSPETESDFSFESGEELTARQLEYLWHFGRYLFVSATRGDGLPCPLFGLWHTGYRQYWSQNMANVNIQMIYWQAIRNGLASLFLPVIDYYFAQLKIFRENAQKLFGCRGIWVPAGTTPYEFYPNQVVPVIMNWTGAAAWLCADFYRYYQYTGDTVAFFEKILPFMLETAAFYEDFCQTDATGKTLFFPSVSPENSPGNFFLYGAKENMRHTMPTAVNATMDVALVRELYGHLIAECEKLSGYETQIAAWKKRLETLPAYTLNEDGAVREWLDDRFSDHYLHRHLSHLYPVFPGDDLQNLTPEQQTGFHRAVDFRLPDGQSGWSLTYSACIMARFGDGERALGYLDTLGSCCLLSNGMTTHNDWRNSGKTLYLDGFAPIQLDANMGLVQALNEMLLCVDGQQIELLPALPKRLASGRFDRFTVPGGTVSMTWDESAGSATVTVTAKRELSLQICCRVPWLKGENTWAVQLAPGQTETHSFGEKVCGKGA